MDICSFYCGKEINVFVSLRTRLPFRRLSNISNHLKEKVKKGTQRCVFVQQKNNPSRKRNENKRMWCDLEPCLFVVVIFVLVKVIRKDR